MFDSGESLETLPFNGSYDSDTRFSSPTIKQRTLKNSISCTGIGLHTGSKITITLHPADADTGIVFRRTDIPGGGAVIPARWSSVSDTRMNTCIADTDGVTVRTIEHLMAALAGMAIDNATIDINGPEVPVMDGSAAPFLFLVECAGVVEQAATRQAVKILKRIAARDGDKIAVLMPGRTSTLRVEIDFSVAAIRRQECFLPMSVSAFKSEISRARTFGFEQEVAAMRTAGLARGGSLDNAVVISCDGEKVLNEEGLRYEDEFVRHKMLDAVGDLYLAGAPILGHFHGVRSGHAVNNRLLRELFADRSAWTMVPFGGRDAAMEQPSFMPRLLPVAVSA
jgi:UDP-3-O-[3-hydroxymyristoyl] N-acetylglucosamine deacetylase